MFGGVGLKTPRGSGTSGFVQRNLASVPERRASGAPKSSQRASNSLLVSEQVKRAQQEDIERHLDERKLENEAYVWAEAQGYLDGQKNAKSSDELRLIVAAKVFDLKQQRSASLSGDVDARVPVSYDSDDDTDPRYRRKFCAPAINLSQVPKTRLIDVNVNVDANVNANADEEGEYNAVEVDRERRRLHRRERREKKRRERKRRRRERARRKRSRRERAHRRNRRRHDSSSSSSSGSSLSSSSLPSSDSSSASSSSDSESSERRVKRQRR
jgi:serine/arginine repetitive matrix protein 2